VTRRLLGERGTAIVETALTLPILLLVSVGIFEFGRAYQTWQILTNATREGARIAVLPGMPAGAPQARTLQYMQAGGLTKAALNEISITAVDVSLGGAATAGGSRVTVNYPFEFMVLQPVARLITSGSMTGAPFTLTASASMRNESQ
jgi:Flp pilus assembly protein TadG